MNNDFTLLYSNAYEKIGYKLSEDVIANHCLLQEIDMEF